MTTGVHSTFDLMVSALGRSPTSSFVLCSLFSDALDLPQEASTSPLQGNGKRLPPTTVRCAPRTASDPKTSSTPNRRLYIRPHVQEYLAGLDAEWEERLTRWTLGVRSALEVADALPPFPTAVAATPEGMDPALENGRLARGQLEQAGSALGPTGRRETTEDGDAAPRGALCIYCRRALHNFGGDSEVGHSWSTITCDHGEFVHAACMLDHAECLGCGHTDPQPCVVRRSGWLARAQPPHLAELVEDLPRPRPAGRWAAVEGAL